MRKLLSPILAILLAFPVQPPSAQATAAEECAKTYKIAVGQPDPGSEDDEKTVQKRCAKGGGNSTCAKSYQFMWRKYREYSTRSNGICAKVAETQSQRTGEGATGMGETAALTGSAKEALTELKTHQEEDNGTLKKYRDQNLANAKKLVEGSDEKTKKLVADRVKEIEAMSSVSEADRAKFVDKIKKLPNVSEAAKEELGAAVEAARFQTMVGADAKGRGDAAAKLGALEETNTKNKEKSSSFGLGDAAKYLKDIALLPVNPTWGTWKGSEYLGLYPVITSNYQTIAGSYNVEYAGNSTPLTTWLRS
ncbi:MAG: hypothetical protein EOP11_13375 [Proteobacteria bacterium]|nr:MAG: hypothetical protein EOP11_13375 [Pseudomonadota bacterium]